MLAVALAAVMLVAAGCQAVAGLDLNGVLKNALKVQSMEGKQSVEFQLKLKPEALAAAEPEEAAIASLLSKVKLELTDIKMKDANTGSFDGALTLGDMRLGFNLRTAGNLTVLKLDGLAKPIELDLTAESLSGLLGGTGMPGLGGGMMGTGLPAAASPDMQAEFKQLADSLIDIVGGYAIDNLPNPTRLTVEPATAQVGGESLPLMKVHADINGEELWKWAGDYLDALIADREGLEEALTGVMKLLAENQELWESLGEGNPFAGMPEGAELEEEIGSGVEAILDALTEVQKEYRSVNPEDIEPVFNENAYIKADIYADAKLHIRKQSIELGFKTEAPSDAAAEPGMNPMAMAASVMDGFVIRMDSESWNINGDVTPDAPVKTKGAITPERLEGMQGYQFLRELDAESALYDLMRNKLHIGKQEITMYPSYDDYPPIVTPDGRTLVPLRSVVSQLGASVSANPDGTIRVYDDGARTGIDLQLGSRDAVVNGKPVKWSYPVTLLASGVTYVPARDLAAALECKISWQAMYEGSPEQVFVISREVD